MAKEKVEKPSEEMEVRDYLPMVNDLMEKIRTNPKWTKDDETKLKKLDKLVGLLTKIANLEKKTGKQALRVNRDGDESLIRKFLKVKKRNGKD